MTVYSKNERHKCFILGYNSNCLPLTYYHIHSCIAKYLSLIIFKHFIIPFAFILHAMSSTYIFINTFMLYNALQSISLSISNTFVCILIQDESDLSLYYQSSDHLSNGRTG